LSAVLLGLSLAACAREEGAVVREMPDLRLATAAGPLAPSLATCPTDKCLTVIVAPWCGICRKEAPNIVQFRRWLAQKGVSSRVIVGLSPDAQAVRAFAETFGPDALVDADAKVQARATPTFLVSDRDGKILKVLEGFPSASKGPADLAQLLGLI
jgi:thiol-disulfide isomerase/thioredoxin